jgi:hypothetical protein
MAGQPGFDSWQEQGFVPRHDVKSSSGAHTTPIRWVPEALQLVHEGDHPSTPSDEVKNV